MAEIIVSITPLINKLTQLHGWRYEIKWYYTLYIRARMELSNPQIFRMRNSVISRYINPHSIIPCKYYIYNPMLSNKHSQTTHRQHNINKKKILQKDILLQYKDSSHFPSIHPKQALNFFTFCPINPFCFACCNISFLSDLLKLFKSDG